MMRVKISCHRYWNLTNETLASSLKKDFFVRFCKIILVLGIASSCSYDFSLTLTYTICTCLWCAIFSAHIGVPSQKPTKQWYHSLPKLCIITLHKLCIIIMQMHNPSHFCIITISLYLALGAQSEIANVLPKRCASRKRPHLQDYANNLHNEYAKQLCKVYARRLCKVYATWLCKVYARWLCKAKKF